MKKILRDFFTFSAGERKGIVVLIILVIGMGGINLVIVSVRPPARQEANPAWMKDSGAMHLKSDTAGQAYEPIQESLPVYMAADEPFPFDPNNASFEELVRLGLNSRVSRTILKYRSKGGKFRKAEDLKKIFGLTELQYSRISDYVRIHPWPRDSGTVACNVPVSHTGRLDINHADSVLFEGLPGIGPVLARRIIRYRLLLGGFYCPDQIKEVYGIHDSIYLLIAGRLSADTTLLKRINVNTATEKELARHPYLDRYVASGIIRYRMQVSRIRNINELKINGIISEPAFGKIKNYLSI
jgi:DNA uptake protein ComE-like DNA-binding protein